MSEQTFCVVPDLKINDVEFIEIRNVKKSLLSKTLICRSQMTRPCINTNNGFLDSVMFAYNYHHALMLTPDDIWIAIMVQFSFFMEKIVKS
jgi:Domain of unknown function (DUF4419)